MGKTNKNDAARSQGHATKIILAVTALVVAATMYVVVADPFHVESKRPKKESMAAEAEKVRRSIEGLLSTADAIDPRGGAASLAQRRLSYEQAADLGRSFVQYSDQRDVLIRPLLAKALLRLGKTGKAEKTVNALLKLEPRSAEGLCLKGEILQLRRDPAALEHFRRAAESGQATPEIMARYGTALIPAGQYERSETMLLKALRGGCRSHGVLLGLSMLAMRDNRFAQAEGYLVELTGRSAPSVQTQVMLAQCQKENAKPAEAEKTLRQVLSKRDIPDLYIPLGDLLDMQGKPADAAAAYARAAKDSSRKAQACFKAARTYHAINRYDLAQKYIDLAASIVDDDEVRYWQKRIEAARTGKPEPKPGSLLTSRPGSSAPGAADANSGSATTRPGGLLDFKWR